MSDHLFCRCFTSNVYLTPLDAFLYFILLYNIHSIQVLIFKANYEKTTLFEKYFKQWKLLFLVFTSRALDVEFFFGPKYVCCFFCLPKFSLFAVWPETACIVLGSLFLSGNRTFGCILLRPLLKLLLKQRSCVPHNHKEFYESSTFSNLIRVK